VPHLFIECDLQVHDIFIYHFRRNCLALFVYGLFFESGHESMLFQDFIVGPIILALIIMIYFIYECAVGKTDSGVSGIALFPCKLDVLAIGSATFPPY
jgi:hypothetical protein